MFPDGAHDVLGALDVCEHSLVRKILADRPLFHGRRIENNIDVPQYRSHACVVADITDAELEQFLEVTVDNLGRRSSSVLEVEAHEMLLSFISGEHDDLRRLAELFGHETADERFAKRTGTTGDQ